MASSSSIACPRFSSLITGPVGAFVEVAGLAEVVVLGAGF
jgi:hypothetical protein